MSEVKIAVTVNGRKHEAWFEPRTLLVTFHAKLSYPDEPK